MFGVCLFLTDVFPFFKTEASQYEAGVLPLNQVLRDIQTPQELTALLKKEFKFRSDEELFGITDYWQAPEEFWKSKSGDCEDFALFAQRWLLLQKQESYLVSLYGPDTYAHTFVIFKENGHHNVINEDSFYRYRADSIEEAAARIYPRWTWGAIAERRGNRGRLIQVLYNPHTPEKSPSDAFRSFPL